MVTVQVSYSSGFTGNRAAEGGWLLSPPLERGRSSEAMTGGFLRREKFKSECQLAGKRQTFRHYKLQMRSRKPLRRKEVLFSGGGLCALELLPSRESPAHRFASASPFLKGALKASAFGG